MKYITVAAPAAGANIPQHYALYGLKTKPGYGDCNVQAAIFYYMAKVIGYSKMEFVQGKVPQGNKVMGSHAWCELPSGTKIYFFDPNAVQAGNVGYKTLYGTPGSYRYTDSHNHVIQYAK